MCHAGAAVQHTLLNFCNGFVAWNFNILWHNFFSSCPPLPPTPPHPPNPPTHPTQVYLAKYHETKVAVKCLTAPGIMEGTGSQSNSSIAAQELALPQAVLARLQQVRNCCLNEHTRQGP